jgi:hypothetical protein
MIFVGVILLVSAIAFLFRVVNGNYQKSPNSSVGYYTVKDLIECTDYEIKSNLCKLQLVYTDGTNIYKNDTDPKTHVGPTTVFYEERNPRSYMVTPSPYVFPGIFSCIACLTITVALVRLMIMRSTKDGAAIIGGLDVASSVIRNIKN